MIQKIDFETWERKTYFENYKTVDLPYIIVTADIDITNLYEYTHEKGLSMYFSMIYATKKMADGIRNFRYRFKGDEAFLIDENIAFATHLQPGDSVFKTIPLDNYPTLYEFASKNRKKADEPVDEALIGSIRDRYDYINYSCIPWIHYSGFVRTIADFHGDCNPKMTFGKYVKKDGRVSIPFSCQTHHGLMDGLHVGTLYENLQKWINEKGWEQE